MLDIVKITKEEEFKKTSREEFLDFMFTHLDRFGDPKEDINKSIDYAFSDAKSEGGFLLAAFYEDKLVGGLIMNETGMSGYIPENILVYVAVDAKYRGKGFGGEIVKESFKQAKGDVKLHVEYDNPAKRLYERLGFKNKYAEMRYDNK
ncbi:MAG TPA: GNAT family N-acetyltransferase [Salinivirga sp.]|uniref:GNAT family N-acetyltransferase n=1 Tax=Salinivirga sp. TaxID=1970192 RepID=UPI002B475798|nr:GNAT family N-acetyltransferase [Salinivirga sp.]HKK58537.1 GNAT family N-acetyltransferase [Salinivirga sp.]